MEYCCGRFKNASAKDSEIVFWGELLFVTCSGAEYPEKHWQVRVLDKWKNVITMVIQNCPFCGKKLKDKAGVNW